MTRNNFRAVGIGVTGGLIAAFGTIAFFEMDLEITIPNAVRRWLLSPADRAVYDAICQAQADKRAASDRKREQQQAGLRAKFRPDLLSTYPAVQPLSALPLADLISEIRYAKTRKRDEIHTAGHGYGSTETAMWTQQIAALRSEFQRRDGEPMSFLDRTRYNAASSAVHSYDDEWPPLWSFGAEPTQPPQSPQFDSPDTAAFGGETHTTTEKE
ncbi:hypothetical protein GZH49_02875 [Nocardia terpenica]|uniref:hypothetical protein n=1 Tax=Nocardia terpenica TaxID=455432 RepID=UPI002FE0F4E3